MFEALLKLKKKQFEELNEFQQDHMDSINEADLDQSSTVENQTEQMMRETRMENESLDHFARGG
ncbi:MAG: hypothetical protein U5L96_07460 [Owenweeksia sp.]|nr:hypothetical protein [Owenweeksia sp.]